MEHYATLAHTLARHRAQDPTFTFAYLTDTIAIWLVVGLLVFMGMVVVARDGLQRFVARCSRHNYR